MFQMGLSVRIDDDAEKMQLGDQLTIGNLDFITDQLRNLICKILNHPCRRRSSPPSARSSSGSRTSWRKGHLPWPTTWTTILRRLSTSSVRSTSLTQLSRSGRAHARFPNQICHRYPTTSHQVTQPGSGTQQRGMLTGFIKPPTPPPITA